MNRVNNGSQTVHEQLVSSRIILTAVVIMGGVLLSGCAGKYSSSWSCKTPEGIGCSSIAHADEIARKHIILNEGAGKSKQQESDKVLIKEHYSDLEKIEKREVGLD